MWLNNSVISILFLVAMAVILTIPHEMAFAATTQVSIVNGASSKACQISQTCYYPDQVQVEAGDAVTWTNGDATTHTVTSVDSNGTPDGKFDSSTITAGQTFSYTFNNAGTYNYFCSLHPWMTGVITVQGFSVSSGQSSSNGKILVSITKNAVVYLSSQDRMVQAHVQILDYSAADGDLYMKIIKTSSNAVISQSKIFARLDYGNFWSTDIGYFVNEQNIIDPSLVGSYQIQVSPQDGAYVGSATFSVLQAPVPGPQIQSITAADPTGNNTSYSNGDTITVAFSEPTNEPKAATKTDLDKLFSFSQNLGANYIGTWTDPSTLVIKIADSKGAAPPTVGSFTFTLKQAGNLTSADGMSLASTAISPVLLGTFVTPKQAINNSTPNPVQQSPAMPAKIPAQVAAQPPKSSGPIVDTENPSTVDNPTAAPVQTTYPTQIPQLQIPSVVDIIKNNELFIIASGILEVSAIVSYFVIRSRKRRRIVTATRPKTDDFKPETQTDDAKHYDLF